MEPTNTTSPSTFTFRAAEKVRTKATGLVVVGLLAVPAVASAVTYTIQNIGSPTLAGGYAYALNNDGEVATTSLVKSYTFQNTTFSNPQEIVIRNAATSTPGVVVQGINDLGEVTGRFRTAGNPTSQTSGFVLRTNGTVDIFNFPGLSSTSISSLNDTGSMVGETRSDLSVFGVIRGFLYKDGAYSEVHVPAATLTRAYGINDAGLVVGQYQNDDAINRPFTFSGGIYSEIILADAPGGVLSAFATGISDNGSIIGSYRNTSNVSGTWVRSADGSYAYPTLPGTGWSINDAGQISGSYLDAANGNARTAFLATPVPEPSSPLLMAALGILALRRRRTVRAAGVFITKP